MKKILLVDDSAAIRNILKASLFGDYEILEASNGEEGFTIAMTTSIDFLLLDVNMPVMDGITLVKKLRETDKYNNSPIVMLTMESTDNKILQGKEAGATGWIVKPCDPDKLMSVIKKFI